MRVIVEKREELKDKEIKWEIAERPGRRKTMNTKEQFLEKTKASIRAKVEHSFRIIKHQFGYDKIRYKDPEKNANRLAVLSAFTNLLICQKMLPSRTDVFGFCRMAEFGQETANRWG